MKQQTAVKSVTSLALTTAVLLLGIGIAAYAFVGNTFGTQKNADKSFSTTTQQEQFFTAAQEVDLLVGQKLPGDFGTRAIKAQKEIIRLMKEKGTGFGKTTLVQDVDYLKMIDQLPRVLPVLFAALEKEPALQKEFHAPLLTLLWGYESGSQKQTDVAIKTLQKMAKSHVQTKKSSEGIFLATFFRSDLYTYDQNRDQVILEYDNLFDYLEGIPNPFPILDLGADRGGFRPLPPDVDADGIPNEDDNCRLVGNVDQFDLDGDGLGDVCDPDLDGDWLRNEIDECPRVVALGGQPWLDTDRDRIPDVCDDDMDNDGLFNAVDNCQLAVNPNQADDDGDGFGNACDDLVCDPHAAENEIACDRDGDGRINQVDNCVWDPNPQQENADGDRRGDLCDQCPNVADDHFQIDSDQDGRGDLCDDDRDGDGVDNNEDNCVEISNPGQEDGDNDDIGDLCDQDDGVDPARDNCLDHFNPDQLDTDGDGFGDVCDRDRDNDEVGNEVGGYQDNCLLVPNFDQRDTDRDGFGDACSTDDDGDGILDAIDNCQFFVNNDQADQDLDNIGDVCDTDIDGDGFRNDQDFCPQVPNGDMCRAPNGRDADRDGVDDGVDNCSVNGNPGQGDRDRDRVGDVCDQDDDGDGVPDISDNCVLLWNPDQANRFGGFQDAGDACRDSDGDFIMDAQDNCLLTVNPNQSDVDQDGRGDACDWD